MNGVSNLAFNVQSIPEEDKAHLQNFLGDERYKLNWRLTEKAKVAMVTIASIYLATFIAIIELTEFPNSDFGILYNMFVAITHSTSAFYVLRNYYRFIAKFKIVVTRI